jgi:hypothetical protein
MNKADEEIQRMRECIGKLAQRIRFMSNTLEVVLPWVPDDTNNSRNLRKAILDNIEDAQQDLTRLAR